MKRSSWCGLEEAARALSRAFFLAVLLAGVSAVAVAAPTQTISGTVKDTTGTLMSGVTVHLSNPATGVALNAVTDTTGRYHFENIPSGAWEVSFAGLGFETGKNALRIVRAGMKSSWLSGCAH